MAAQCNRTDSPEGRLSGWEWHRSSRNFKREMEKKIGEERRENYFIQCGTVPEENPALSSLHFTLFSMFQHFSCLKTQKCDCNYSTYFIYISLRVSHIYCVPIPVHVIV